MSLRSADGHLVVLDLPLVLPHRWTPTLERLVRDSRRRRIGGRLVIFDEGFVVVPRRSAHRLPSELGTSSVADLAVQLPQNKAFSATDVDHAAATPAAFFPTRKAYIGCTTARRSPQGPQRESSVRGPRRASRRPLR